MKFTREWCIPNKDTLQMEPAYRLVKSYLKPDIDIVDPFAKNCMIAKWRNDLNPETSAEYHLDALEFLKMCQSKISADLVIFDPPYSLRQIKECYDGFGRKLTQEESKTAAAWSKEKDAIHRLLKVGGIVISFGWNSSGMGLSRLYEIIEIKLLCHGGPHYDTIIVVEKKITHQLNLFESFGTD